MKRTFLLILFLFTGVISLFVVSFHLKQTSSTSNLFFGQVPTPASYPYSHPSLNQIIPGSTTTDQLIQILGKPATTQQKGTYTILSFPHIDTTTDFVYTQNNLVEYTKGSIPDTNIDVSIKPDIYMYDPIAGEDKSWHIFPTLGMAYLVNDAAHTTSSILRFVPTTITNFQTQAQQIFSFSLVPFSFTDLGSSTSAIKTH